MGRLSPESHVSDRRGLGLGGFLALAALAGMVVAALGVFPFRQVLARERAVDLSREKLDALVVENMRLEYQIAALQTDAEVERLAREQFGLVLPGETGFVAVVPTDVVDPAPTERSALLERTDPWWRKIWDFLTGRDLDPDG